MYYMKTRSKVSCYYDCVVSTLHLVIQDVSNLDFQKKFMSEIKIIIISSSVYNFMFIKYNSM